MKKMMIPIVALSIVPSSPLTRLCGLKIRVRWMDGWARQDDGEGRRRRGGGYESVRWAGRWR
jgi:hypothetical protein